jgi:hypothetical protein
VAAGVLARRAERETRSGLPARRRRYEETATVIKC